MTHGETEESRGHAFFEVQDGCKIDIDRETMNVKPEFWMRKKFVNKEIVLGSDLGGFNDYYEMKAARFSLSGMTFEGCTIKLEGNQIDLIHADRCVFVNCLIEGDFSGFKARGSEFRSCTLKGWFQEASFFGSEFHHCVLNFNVKNGYEDDKINMGSVVMRNVEINQEGNYAALCAKEANLLGVKIKGKYSELGLKAATLKDVTFEGEFLAIDASMAQFEESGFANSTCRGTFEDAEFKLSWLDKSNLEGCNFRNAVFNEGDVHKSNLSDADFRGANLKWMYLRDTKLSRLKYNDKTTLPRGLKLSHRKTN